jgi:hypothetical protein
MNSEYPNRHDEIKRIISAIVAKEMFMSYSSLSNFKESPKSFIDYKLKAYKETDAMIFGTMLHCLVLEPNEFELRYFVLKDSEICSQIGGAKPRATKAYKEWKQEQEQKANGRIIVEPEDAIQAKTMSYNIRNNRAARVVMSKAKEREKKVEWEYLNFNFRGILDGYGEIIFDLKTCADASPKKFQRDMITMDYHIQAALYLMAVEKKPYYIIAADKSGGVSVHNISDSLIQYANDEIQKVMSFFNAACLQVLSGKPDVFDESYEYWSERFDGVYVADKPAYLY